MIGRRSFITGLVSLVAAPAIVRAGSLMPVKQVVWTHQGPWIPCSNYGPYGRGPLMHVVDLVKYRGAFLMPVPGWVMDDLRAAP